eukprot:588306-Prorocentrum_minimum.AAC.2
MSDSKRFLTIVFVTFAAVFLVVDVWVWLMRVRREKGFCNAHNSDGLLAYNVFASAFQVRV